MALSRQFGTVTALGAAQTLAWASSYYLPAMLATPIARELHVPNFTLFAAFSLALLVAAALAPQAGKAIDRFGGRPVLLASNLVFALGLGLLSRAGSVAGLLAAWTVIGIAMGSGLYEAAFSTVVRLHGREARGAITGITLVAGFASTVGWPLTAYMESHHGWRGACLVWAALHLAVGLPLNASVPKASGTATPASPAVATAEPAVNTHRQRTQFLLAYVFAVTWFISTSMAAHLPALFQASGATLTAAVGMSALVGPAQVVGRLLEFGVLKHAPPMWPARLAILAHPLGVAVLLLSGPSGAMAFAILHGVGNGILTIAIGTLPLLLFGPAGYGHRQGMLMVPARVIQAGAPFLFGLCVQAWGMDALWLSALLALSAGAMLLCVAPRSIASA